jgi:hypothetical protein
MSGMGKTSSTLTAIAGIAAGAIAARVIGNYASKMGTVNPKIVSAGQIALGTFFPKFVKGSFGQNLGAGMIAVGGLSLAQNFNVISGIGASDDMQITLSGTDLLSPISGYGEDFGFSDTMSGSSDIDVISGMEYDY